LIDSRVGGRLSGVNLPTSKPEPPKSCPVCFVAMQATKEDRRIIHRCERCGTVIEITRPEGRQG